MSSKGDNEQFTIEKVRSTYTSLTVEDCSAGSKTNTMSSPTITSPSMSTKTSSQPNTVPAADDRNIELNQPQSKPAPEKRKIPPYTNFPNTGPTTKTIKTNTKNTVVEQSPVRKKPDSFPSIVEPGTHSTNRKPVGKPSISFSIVNNKEAAIQIPKSSSEKPLVSYLSPNDNSNPNSPAIQDEIKHFNNDALEKNIQTKALTVLSITKNNSSANQIMVGSPKQMKGPLPFTKPMSSGKSPVNAEIFKPLPKSNSARQPLETNNRNVISKPQLLSNIQGVSNVNSTALNTPELSKNVQTKLGAVDANVTFSKPQQSSSGNAKGLVDTAVSTPTKQSVALQSSARVLKPASTLSVAHISATPTVPQESIHASIRSSPNTNITLFLSSLSESRDSNELLEAINSGTNVNVTQSVTLSKPAVSGAVVLPVVVQQPIPNQKIKPSSTTGIIQKMNVSNSIPITSHLRKNGNVTETSNPSADTSDETISSSSVVDFGKYDSSSYLISSDETETNEEMSSPKKNVQEEPECLTISSDEETEETLSEKNELSFSVQTKEPPVAERNEKVSVGPDGSVETDKESALDVISGDGYVLLNCRTIRIGSFKLSPRQPVVLSKHGLRIVIPSSENVVLKIPFQEITKVLIHFGRSVPVIFYYVTSQMGAKVRRILKMNDPEEVYFDPASNIESQRRITLLPENITDNNRLNIFELFEGTGKLCELSHEEANEILVKSAPREIQRVVKQVPDPVQTIMVFPPPPAKGGISINTEDYSCLAPDVFLNDVIIDFYLKYLYLHHLSAEDREKTHIFSSFFYKRLTDKATPMPRHLKSAGSVITAAEIRHSRVKNWTKNIDIFSKDYIVIPLNENQHWFLAVICFPGLKGPVRYSDNTPIEVESKDKKCVSVATIAADETLITSESEKPSSSIGSVTITPIRLELRERSRICYEDDNDAEDRDEAEATDEEVISEEDTEEEYLSTPTEEKPKQRNKLERESIKQPCILIFDSLAGASRARIIATLRDYLRVEYKVKHGEDRDFSKNVIKGAVPAVPQQDNFTDCGLFVLQYVEAFFDSKITDYHIPIKTLRNWFPAEEVASKRYRIQQLLHNLMTVQNIDIESLNLPDLHLNQSEEDEEEEFYDSEEDFDPSGDGDDYEELVGPPDPAIRYHPYADENEFFDEDDDDDDDIAMMPSSRFDMYDDSDDDSRDDMDSDEDMSDDVYKDLDNLEVEKNKKFRRNMHRRMENSSRCMEEGEEMNVEEIGLTNDEDEDEQQLSSDIEEKINNSNLNRETVSIKLTSVNIRTHSPTSSSGVGAVSSTTCKAKPKETDLAKLKAARPWGSREQTTDDSSIPKKVKYN